MSETEQMKQERYAHEGEFGFKPTPEMVQAYARFMKLIDNELPSARDMFYAGFRAGVMAAVENAGAA